jgi:small subunit ribosomal protein S7
VYFYHHLFLSQATSVFPSFNLNVKKRNFSIILGNTTNKNEESVFIHNNSEEYKKIHKYYPINNRSFVGRFQDTLMRRNETSSKHLPTIIPTGRGQTISKLLKVLRQPFFSKEVGLKASMSPVSPSYIFYFFSNVFMLSEFKHNLQILPLSSLMPFKNLRYLATKAPFVWKSKVRYNIGLHYHVSRSFLKKSMLRYSNPGNQFFFSVFKKDVPVSSTIKQHVDLVDFKYLKANRRRKKNFKPTVKFSKINLLWHSIYKDPVIEKFVNCIMKHGRRTKAENILIQTLVYLKEFAKRQPILTVHKALQLCQPVLEARALMGSRKAHFIPKEVTLRRRVMIAIKSIIKIARESSARKQPFYVRLAHELLLAANDDGKAIEKIRSIHEKAFANRANLRYSGGRKKRKR